MESAAAAQIPVWGSADECIDCGVGHFEQPCGHLDALMQEARRGAFDVVVVWRFDRFARSVKHCAEGAEFGFLHQICDAVLCHAETYSLPTTPCRPKAAYWMNVHL